MRGRKILREQHNKTKTTHGFVFFSTATVAVVFFCRRDCCCCCRFDMFVRGCDESEAPPKSLFVSAFFFAHFSLFRVLNPNRRNTNTREAKLCARGGTYTFERDERLLRGDYIDKTHARAQNTHNRASTLLLLFEASSVFRRSITRKEKRRGEKERTFFPRYI